MVKKLLRPGLLDVVLDRIDHLTRRSPRCGECLSEQVQLIGGSMMAPARWRCRLCQFTFTHEPEDHT